MQIHAELIKPSQLKFFIQSYNLKKANFRY